MAKKSQTRREFHTTELKEYPVCNIQHFKLQQCY